MPLLSLNAFICEKILMEQDQVISAIRLVEVFSVQATPDLPLDKQGPLMFVVASGKVPADDDSEHLIEFSLIRPNGETKPVGEPIRSVFPGGAQAGFPRGFNVALQLLVFATQMGLHYISIRFDGEEVRRVPFILQPVPTPVAKP
jgi:hypothetical protein